MMVIVVEEKDVAENYKYTEYTMAMQRKNILNEFR